MVRCNAISQSDKRQREPVSLTVSSFFFFSISRFVHILLRLKRRMLGQRRARKRRKSPDLTRRCRRNEEEGGSPGLAGLTFCLSRPDAHLTPASYLCNLTAPGAGGSRG